MKQDMLGGTVPAGAEEMPPEEMAPEQGGMGAMSPEAAMQQAPEAAPAGPDDETIRQNVLEHIASLTDEQKNWIQANLTPETWAMITLLNGRAVGEALRPFVDESVILVPMDRREFQQMYQQGSQEAQAMSGQKPSQKPQQSPATAPMSAPVQQPNAPAATLS